MMKKKKKTCRTLHWLPIPMPKRARRVYVRNPMNTSAWWTAFLSQEAKAIQLNDPDGKVATSFRRAFRVPYMVFKERILDFSVRMWWPEWHEYKVDAFGRPVGNLELKLLGCLNTLGMGANHFSVGLQTNISEEVHRKFFVEWVGLMASVKELFIYMPQEAIQLKFVVDEYKAMGLPGCVGSVDCVHIGWDMCPVQYTNMHKGKEGYTSIAYEVICTSRKFIQSVSAGHPGARNDKHIVRTDNSVMSLLDGNGWLNSQSWETKDRRGRTKVSKGLYLICDGGYHRWPCLMFPVKSGAVGSPLSKWAGMMESVRKDIECVFGILKKRFHYLKTFNRMRKQKNIDNAFTTCCIIHNILLETDGWLDEDLPNYLNGVKDRLGRLFTDDPREMPLQVEEKTIQRI
ncbi:Plant transposon protein [Fragilaria crotonensis]|nr:Plant transposon protein [Fragilaria crotonensis]